MLLTWLFFDWQAPSLTVQFPHEFPRTGLVAIVLNNMFNADEICFSFQTTHDEPPSSTKGPFAITHLRLYRWRWRGVWSHRWRVQVPATPRVSLSGSAACPAAAGPSPTPAASAQGSGADSGLKHRWPGELGHWVNDQWMGVSIRGGQRLIWPLQCHQLLRWLIFHWCRFCPGCRHGSWVCWLASGPLPRGGAWRHWKRRWVTGMTAWFEVTWHVTISCIFCRMSRFLDIGRKHSNECLIKFYFKIWLKIETDWSLIVALKFYLFYILVRFWTQKITLLFDCPDWYLCVISRAAYWIWQPTAAS